MVRIIKTDIMSKNIIKNPIPESPQSPGDRILQSTKPISEFSLESRFDDPYKGTICAADKNTPDNWIERHPDMVRLTGSHPFNSEVPQPTLSDVGFITPNRLHYTRNHGAVPKLSWDTHIISISISKGQSFQLTMDMLADMKQISRTVTLTCAGNRRKENNMHAKTVGFSWNTGATSTSVWKGVLMSDVLLAAGLNWQGEDWHVHMEGSDTLMDGHRYGTSLPLGHVMNPANDVMLAMEQNGELLHPDRGFPVRVVIPGWIGGRMVKWLSTLDVRLGESTNHYHYFDNRILPSYVDKELADKEEWWYKTEYLFNELNLNSVISRPFHNEHILSNGSVSFSGYAYSGGGRHVTRVEVTLDGGSTWLLATRKVEEKPNLFRKYWCWIQWEVELSVLQLMSCQYVAVRAWDESNNTQPCDLTWNVMGMGNNSWFRVKVVRSLRQGTYCFKFIHPTQGAGLDNKDAWMVSKPLLKQLEHSPSILCTYTMGQVEAHRTESDCWIVVNDKVYDCTPFLSLHPGGLASILMNGGTDCTDDFIGIHSDKATKMLDKYLVGALADEGTEAKFQSPEFDKSIPRDDKFIPSNCWLNVKSYVEFTLTRKTIINHDTILLRFSPASNLASLNRLLDLRTTKDEASKVLGLPVGQHIMVKGQANDQLLIRAYTPLIDIEESKEDFSLLVKVYRPDDSFPVGGKMSQHLDSLSVGKTIQVKGPLGHISYQNHGMISVHNVSREFKNVAFMCGGTGITPAYRILTHALKDDSDLTVFYLLYANRSPADILLRDELDRLASIFPDRFKCWYTIDGAHAPAAWPYSTGHIDYEMVRNQIPNGSDGDTFVGMCGPPAMIEYACVPNLKKLGYHEENFDIF